jgi:alpha-N-arabinofuranosidase
VQTQNSEWWMVCLAMRPYGGYYYNLGRETFLVPVAWEDGWLIVNPGIGRVEFESRTPDLPEHRWDSFPTREDFDELSLGFHWNSWRAPSDIFATLRERPGYLRMHLRPERLSEEVDPSFVGRRQQHIHFRAETALEFIPQNPNECAGLALVQNSQFHFLFVVTQTTHPVIQLIQRAHGVEVLMAEQPIQAEKVYFKVEAHEQAYNFYFAEETDKWRSFAEYVDGRILSTPVAGGFVGAYLAMYASSNGRSSTNHADFDWFEYVGLDQ